MPQDNAEVVELASTLYEKWKAVAPIAAMSKTVAKWLAKEALKISEGHVCPAPATVSNTGEDVSVQATFHQDWSMDESKDIVLKELWIKLGAQNLQPLYLPQVEVVKQQKSMSVLVRAWVKAVPLGPKPQYSYSVYDNMLSSKMYEEYEAKFLSKMYNKVY